MFVKAGLKQLTRRTRSTLSYTPPSMVDLPLCWSSMSPQLQEEITEYLVWKMEEPWKFMNRDELKASYYISYGPWGPRGSNPKIQLTPMMLIWRSFFSTVLFMALGVSLVNLKSDKQVDEALNRLKENYHE